MWLVKRKPASFNMAAVGGKRCLSKLGRESGLAHGRAHFFGPRARFACRMQNVADLPNMNAAVTDWNLRALLGNRRQAQVVPDRRIPGQLAADQIVVVQPLLDDDDHTFLLVVQAREQRVREPSVGFLADAFGIGILGFKGIVDDQIIAAEPR